MRLLGFLCDEHLRRAGAGQWTAPVLIELTILPQPTIAATFLVSTDPTAVAANRQRVTVAAIDATSLAFPEYSQTLSRAVLWNETSKFKFQFDLI